MTEIKKTGWVAGTILRDASGDWDSLKAVEKIPFGSLVEYVSEFHCQVATAATKQVHGIALVPKCPRKLCGEDYKYAYKEGENVDIALHRGVIALKIEEDPKEWEKDKPLYVKAGKITATKEGEEFARFQEILDEKSKIVSVWKV